MRGLCGHGAHHLPLRRRRRAVHERHAVALCRHALQVLRLAGQRDAHGREPDEDRVRENARIENFQAHMHLRGKGMRMEAIYPDGKRETLSQVTDFNFNWHNMYIYADDAAPLLPKGTILHFVAWYDNTRNNKVNPDPDQWVGWGDRTVDEMGHAWLNITYYNAEEFKAEQAKRAELLKTTEAGRNDKQ